MEIKKLKIAAVAAVASCLALGGATASLALGEDAKIASAATVVEHFEERAPGMLIPGNSVYIAIDDQGTGDGYLGTGNYYVYYFDNSSNAWSKAATEVNGYDFSFDGHSATVYETVVPDNPNGDKWETAIVVCNSYADWPSGESWRQTVDVVPSTETDNCIQVRMATSTENKRLFYTNQIEAYNRLAHWGSTLKWWGNGSVCHEDGNTPFDELSAAWTESIVSFEKFGQDVKAFMSNATIDLPTNDNFRSLITQYDYLCKTKYNGISVPGKELDNFARR